MFRFCRRLARDEGAARGGSGSGEAESRRAVDVRGRCDTQSWTRRETCGLEVRLRVFFEEGSVVMMIVGKVEYGEEGR